MTVIDHARCSELLASYVRGELAPTTAEVVGAHLEICGRCAQEHRAVRALLAHGSELDDDEKQWLHRGVRAALGEAIVPRPEPSRRRARWGELVGAAAAVVLLTAGGLWIATQGDDAGDTAGTTAESAQEAPAQGGDAAALADMRVFFDANAGVVEKRDLIALGRRGFLGPPTAPGRFALNTQAESAGTEGAGADDAASTQSDVVAEFAPQQLVNRLTAAAPAGDDIVRRCANLVLESQTQRIIPVYGAFATLRDERKVEVLVLGFNFSAKPEGPLDRFMIWVWPRGSCDIPLHFVQGKIRS